MIHVPIAVDTAAIIASEIAAMRNRRRLATPSCPGLSRASTSVSAAEEDVDGRDKPGHDRELLLLVALISPDAPQPTRCRCGRSARGCTCPRHRLAATRICPGKPRAPHRPR